MLEVARLRRTQQSHEATPVSRLRAILVWKLSGKTLLASLSPGLKGRRRPGVVRNGAKAD